MRRGQAAAYRPNTANFPQLHWRRDRYPNLLSKYLPDSIWTQSVNPERLGELNVASPIIANKRNDPKPITICGSAQPFFRNGDGSEP